MAEETLKERLSKCRNVYLTRDESLRVAKVLIDVVTDPNINSSRIEIGEFMISAEIDPEYEDGVYLIKQRKITGRGSSQVKMM